MICSVAPALQRLHSRLTRNQLEEIRIFRRHCLGQSSPRLDHERIYIDPGYDHHLTLAKTVAAQIKWSQNGVVNVSPEQPRGKMRIEREHQWWATCLP